jgi:hypothetical protein
MHRWFENRADWFITVDLVEEEISMKRKLALELVTAEVFLHYFKKAREINLNIRNFTTPPNPQTLKFHDCYLSRDGLSGYSVADDGELCNVFSIARGRGKDIVLHAVQVGDATKTFNFDGKLTLLYNTCSFNVVDRAPWDAELAPEDWEYEKFGTPDVVWMKLEQ